MAVNFEDQLEAVGDPELLVGLVATVKKEWIRPLPELEQTGSA